MRLAIIGNSHVGCLKQAWDRMGEGHHALDLTFFAARGRGIRDLSFDGRSLVPGTEELRRSLEFTSGGQGEIRIDEFDSILLYAIGARAYFARDGLFYTTAASNRAVLDFVEGRPFMHILSLLSGVFKGPIYVGHAPLRSAPSHSSDQDCGPYVRGLELLNSIVLAPIGVRMVGQPLDTIVNGVNTDARYSRGSRRLAIGDEFDDKGHPDDEDFHMNDSFGELWLRKFFAETGLASPTTSPAPG